MREDAKEFDATGRDRLLEGRKAAERARRGGADIDSDSDSYIGGSAYDRARDEEERSRES